MCYAWTEDEIQVFKLDGDRLGLELDHAELQNRKDKSLNKRTILTDILRFEATAPLRTSGILLCTKK